MKGIIEVYGEGEVKTIEYEWSKDDYLLAIQDLEDQITIRRIREAVLTDIGKVWLEAKEAEINLLRSKLSDIV